MSCRELHMLILQDPSNTFSSLSTLKTFFAFLTLNLLYGSWREKEGKCNGFLSWKKNNTFISLTCIIEPFRTQDEEACNILTAFRNFHVHCAASFMQLFIASSAWHFFMTRLCTKQSLPKRAESQKNWNLSRYGTLYPAYVIQGFLTCLLAYRTVMFPPFSHLCWRRDVKSQSFSWLDHWRHTCKNGHVSIIKGCMLK